MPSSSTPSYLNAQSVPPLLHLHAQPISESCYPAGFLKVHYPTLRHDTLMTKPDLAQTENQESQLNQCLAYNSQSAYCAWKKPINLSPLSIHAWTVHII